MLLSVLGPLIDEQLERTKKRGGKCHRKRGGREGKREQSVTEERRSRSVRRKDGRGERGH